MLVAGIGNVFLHDDAFGVEVVRHLETAAPPTGRELDDAEIVDVGIRGVHLAYQLMDGYDLLVLVDATARGDPPGTVTVLEPELELDAAAPELLDPHRLEPGPLLTSVRALGVLPDRVVLVGCEPADVDEGMGLSPAVAAAVAPAADAVRKLIEQFLAERTPKGSDRDEEEAVPAPGARTDRLRRVPPASGHRAVRAHQADVTVPRATASTPAREH
jgi:hydrogenase maturation protease